MLYGLQRPIEDWDDVKAWLADSFSAIDIGDVFDIGPSSLTVYDDHQYVPCAQARALGAGMVWLALSKHVQGAQSVFELDNERAHVSTDLDVLAAHCAAWFRDEHGLHFSLLGCELTPSQV